MLSWQMKNQPHFINISDAVTDVIPLHSVHQASSYEPILTFPVPFPTELDYLGMLFISSAQPLAGGAYLLGLMSSVVLVLVVLVVRRPSSFHSNAFFSKTTYWIFLKLNTMVDDIIALDSMERFFNFSQNSNFGEFFQNLKFQTFSSDSFVT